MTSSLFENGDLSASLPSLCVRRHATQHCGDALHRPIACKENDPFTKMAMFRWAPSGTPLARFLARGDRLPAGGHLVALDIGVSPSIL
jgi:hypothetical protein